MERLTGFGPAIFDLASRRSDQLSYNRMEPARGIGPRLPPYHGGVLPLSLSRHELGVQVSNLESLGSKPSGSAGSPTAHQEPATGLEPVACPLPSTSVRRSCCISLASGMAPVTSVATLIGI